MKKLRVNPEKKVIVESKRNRSVEVLREGRTGRAPFEGISYDTDLIKKYFYHLTNLKAEKVIPIKDGEISGYLGSIKVDSPKSREISLFKKFNEISGFFVLDSNSPEFLYEFDASIEGLFNISAQDFWDKRVFKSPKTFLDI